MFSYLFDIRKLAFQTVVKQLLQLDLEHKLWRVGQWVDNL
jgi:hypothetical protein